MKKVLFALFVIAGMSSCGNPNQQLIENAPLIASSYTDDLGRSISFSEPPQRVVSLAPSVTEIIFAIGAEDKLVARSNACNYPSEALDIPAIETYPDLDLPGIVLVEPDLAVTTTELFTTQIVPFFDKFKINLIFQDIKGTDDIYSNINSLGNLLGHDQQAKYLVDSLQTIEKRIVAATEGQIRYGTLVLIGTNPMVTAGGNSFITELIDKAGGKNLAGELRDKYPEMDINALIGLDPEVLIIPSKDEQAFAQMISAQPILTQMRAVKNKQVYAIDPNLLFRPGPRSIEALAQLTNILHSKISASEFFEPIQ